MKRLFAFSLIELLITLTIIIICSGYTVAEIAVFYTKTRARVETHALLAALHLGRILALKTGMTVVFCPSIDHHHCSENWSDGQILYIKTKNTNNTVLRVLYKIAQPGKLTWQGFQQQNSLQINPAGFPYNQNGTFIYCTGFLNLKIGKAIIISRSGRVRVESRAC